MPYRYDKHYTREEARALLPYIREQLKRLRELRTELEPFDKRVSALTATGEDSGGDLVNRWIRTLLAMQAILIEFQTRRILIKDLDRGLMDFPALLGGKEVFLCWEEDEEDIEHWHDLDAGYAGREHL
jgi:hypothetical protein